MLHINAGVQIEKQTVAIVSFAHLMNAMFLLKESTFTSMLNRDASLVEIMPQYRAYHGRVANSAWDLIDADVQSFQLQ